MTVPVDPEVHERINAIHTKFQRPGDRVARDMAVADALQCPPNHPQMATATAYISNTSGGAQLLTVNAGNPVNRTFQALEGTAAATVCGTLYYREVWDLANAQPVATSFGAGNVVCVIGPANCHTYFVGPWSGESFQSSVQHGHWY